jgi:ornithine cyclodeaminase
MFDPLTGRAEALIEATWLTALRTGAGVGAATRALARTDSVCAAMLGAGGMAFHMVEAMLAACPSIREVAVWNRTAERAGRLVNALQRELGRRATFRHAADADEAVARADVVSVCTSSAEPVLRGAWIREGTHVNLAGAHGAAMREGDDDLARRAAVVTADRRESALASGELALALASGAIRLDQVLDIGSVLSGAAPGRRSAADVTWFKSGGIAAQDLVTAQVVLRRARELGLGQRVPFHAGPGGGDPGGD